MRVMAGGTADAGVGCVIALAVREPIRLKPDVLHASRSIDGDVRPRPVTLPAEVRHLLGGQPGQAARDPGGGLKVCFRASMTTLALNSRSRTRRMATEALPGFGGWERPPCSFVEVMRSRRLLSDGGV